MACSLTTMLCYSIEGISRALQRSTHVIAENITVRDMCSHFWLFGEWLRSLKGSFELNC